MDASQARGVQIGDHNTQHNTYVAVPEVRSSYLEQVRQIAPARLVDRDAELAELAAFCTAPDTGPYAWWRAPAWSGKSALMSTFVLHPPPGVRIVSFFVTARLAGQHDRAAFVAVVLEQLAELLGQALPAYLTEATRDAHLLGLLAEAARVCERQGQRLVLVVDGLDEDRGVVAGDDAYSIAGLLPARPVAGLRVIVSSRLHPPLPADVPGHHPLRDTGVVRALTTSAHAGDVRREAERELKRLLRGTATEQDLLGLLTAAGGGLSGADLATLTGVPPWQVEDALHAVSGRTFTTRAGAGAPIYVLGHEELQRSAMTFLGERRLAEYRDRLHTWAGDVRAAGWPPETPDYLLRGYPGLLVAEGDLPRLVALATDEVRHDRMLAVTGADSLAQVEVSAAQDLIVAAAEPDLAALLRVAIQRDYLSNRNAELPTGLPAVWARLGQVARAEALARSITDPHRQAVALAKLADGLGNGDRADLLAERAVGLASEIADRHPRSVAFAALADAFAIGGRHDRATELARQIDSADHRSGVLANLAVSAARHGDHEQARAYLAAAEEAARHIAQRATQESRLSDLADKALADGDLARAERLAGQIDDVGGQARALGRLARAALVAGDLSGAVRLARRITDTESQRRTFEDLVEAAIEADRPADAAELTRSIDNPDRRATALGKIARHVTQAGHYDRAGALVRAIDDPADRNYTIGAIAKIAVDNGAYVPALRLLDDVIGQDASDERARRIQDLVHGVAESDPEAAEQLVAVTEGDADRAAALGELVKIAIRAGDVDRAERLTDVITDADAQLDALRELVGALSSAGFHDRAASAAVRIADPDLQAVELRDLMRGALDRGDRPTARLRADSIVDPSRRADALGELVRAAVEAGESELGEEIVEAITDRGPRAEALTALARAAADAGDPDRAAAAATEVEALARAGAMPARHAAALAALAGAAALAGGSSAAVLLRRGVALAQTIVDAPGRAVCLQALAIVASRLGDVDLVRSLAAEVDAVVDADPDPARRARMLAALARVAAEANDADRAVELTMRIPAGGDQTFALTALAVEAAVGGDIERAVDLAKSIANATNRAYVLSEVADALVVRGEEERAVQVSRAVEEPYWRRDTDLSGRAATAARFGNRTRAVELAMAMSAGFRREEALADLAQQAMDEGDLAAAVAIAESLADADRVGSELARAAMYSGDLDLAVKIARSMVRVSSRSALLTEIVRAALRTGELRWAAMLVVEGKRDAPEQLAALVAWAAAAAGEHDLALEVARACDNYTTRPVVADLFQLAVRDRAWDRAARFAELINDNERQAHALAGLATAAAADGDLDRASVLVGKIKNSTERESAVVDLVRAAVHGGTVDRATVLARGIGGPEAQARALMALAETVEPAAAAPFLAEALTLTRWTEVVRTLAKIRPEAVESVAADLLG